MTYDSVAAGIVNCPEDIVLVVDESASIRTSDFDLMKSFLSDLVSRLDVDNGNTRVGLVSYSSQVKTTFNLNAHTSVKSLQTAITNLSTPRGDTNTHFALEHVRTTLFTSAAGDRSNAPNVVVVVTDGISKDEQATLVSVNNYH